MRKIRKACGVQTFLVDGLLPIDSNNEAEFWGDAYMPEKKRATIYLRVERRAADTEKAKNFFGNEYERNREWRFFYNCPDSLHLLLNRYKDTDMYEFRIKNTESVK